MDVSPHLFFWGHARELAQGMQQNPHGAAPLVATSGRQTVRAMTAGPFQTPSVTTAASLRDLRKLEKPRGLRIGTVEGVDRHLAVHDIA